MTSVKETNYFPRIAIKLLFAFMSASVKSLSKFIALTEKMASARVLLTPNDKRVAQCAK